jgi:pyridoxine 5-phosphate synthase
MTCKLSVNVDHVATLREARKTHYPQPAEAALIAEQAGAHGITVHLRGDRRHIQDADLEALAATVTGKLNLEMALTHEMVGIALRAAPQQVTLVPERPDEITTEGGLDVSSHRHEIEATGRRLRAAGIDVSVFIDPDERQIRELAALAGEAVVGYELNTDAYSKAQATDRAELDRLSHCAELGAELGLKVYAGHGLTTANVGALARLEAIEEFNIGHFIVSRAVLIGMRAAVEEMLAAIAQPAGRG